MLTISLIIPTYNSARTIRPCLESIARQTFRPKEVIVVDRFSQDGTPVIAESFYAKVIQTKANRSQARNVGLEHSVSDGILFVDADMVLSLDLVAECSKLLQEHQALVIPEESFGEGFWAKCKALERQTNLESEIEAARCFGKDPLLSLGGYDSRLEAGEDWDLHYRARAMGLTIGRTVSKLLHDEGDSPLVNILRKKFFYGTVMRGYIASNPTSKRVQLNPFNRIIHPTLTVLPSDPIHGIGVAVLKTLEFVAAGTGWLTSRATIKKHARKNP